MDWTREQKQAIETEGSDTLIAAGAGSGKTAVLVNRIIRMVLDRDEPRDIDSLLVVTFTRAAADEMRSRLYKLLDERLEKASDDNALGRIYDQQVRLQRSWITTIDSFCKRVITENMRESGIDASYSVCDEALGTQLLKEAVREAAEEYSDSHPEQYASLIDVYGSFYSDEKLLDIIEKTVDFSRSFPDPEGWLRSCLDFYREPFPGGDFARTAYGKWLISIIRLKLKAHLGELIKLHSICDANGIENCLSTLDEDIEILRDLSEKMDRPDITWADAFASCDGVKFPRKKSVSKADKESWDESMLALEASVSKRRSKVNGELRDNILKKLFFGSPDTPVIDRENVRENMDAFIGLALLASSLFAHAKAERHVYDYGDMEHTCLNILRKHDAGGAGSDVTGSLEMPEPSELALSYRKKFTEIYVDEYQDTNILQEIILRLIAGEDESGPDIFMVGDMKQSIYSFRNARPDLFMEKYSTYKDLNGDCTDRSGSGGKLIRLNANFRSRAGVIDSINTVFSALMNVTTCGMPYGRDEYLNFGAEYYPAESDNNRKTEIVVIDTGDQKQVRVDKTFIEGYEILCRIKDMIAGGYKVYDTGTKAERPLRYGDICILMRSLSPNGAKLADLLRKGGVPVRDTKDRSGIFVHPEVRTAVAFMHLLDNPLCDIPLVSVLKNVYGFTGDIFVRIKLAVPDRDMPFYKRMQKYASYGDESDTGSGEAAAFDNDERTARDLVSAFISRLGYLRKACMRRPVSETLWECMTENGFLNAVRAMPDGGAAYSNLMRLVSFTSGFDNSGGGSFTDYIRVLETAEKKGMISSASPPEYDAVTVTSIHSSKGLEYPVVILAEAGRGRNIRDESTKLIVHKELGLGPSCFDKAARTIFPSVMKEAIRLRIARDSRAEEMRLLYVAMTRAREKLIITGVGGGFEGFVQKCTDMLDPSFKKPMDYYVLDADDFLTLLGMAVLCKGADNTGSCELVPGSYAASYLSGLLGEQGEESAYPEDVNDDPVSGGLPGGIRFGLPPVKLWAPSSELTVRTPREGKICPAKISVSELKRLSDVPEPDQGPDAVLPIVSPTGPPAFRMLEERDETDGKDAKTGGARAGTLIHCCLEHIDFNRSSGEGADMATAEKYVSELIEDLVRRRFFTDADAKLIPKNILTGFVTSDFARMIASADEVMREIPFAVEYPSDTLFGDPDLAGNSTVVQGIIDCVCRSGGKIILIDYKSDYISGREDSRFEEHSRRYAIQLSVYAEVIRRVFGKLPDRTVLYYLRYGKEFEISGESLRQWKK